MNKAELELNVAPPGTARSRPRERAVTSRGGYVVSPAYDWNFFIMAPAWALLVGIAVRTFALDRHRLLKEDSGGTVHQIAIVALASAAFTHAHLAIVFFRTHLNREVFRRYPHRFTTVPLMLFFASITFDWVFVAASILTVWWDVYHSSLQTFGLGRIYDRRAGNDVELGRSADYWFNLLIYAGPILAGVNLARHLKSFERFEALDAPFLSHFARAALERQGELRNVLIPIALVFALLYSFHYTRLVRRGYVIPIPKVVLYGVTAFVSVVCWGFGSFAEAFLVMNAFHALQYFAIVWWSEKKTIMNFFACTKYPALAILIASGLGYGYWRASDPETYVPFVALGNVVSLMHFWYDGFVWSVRRGDV